MPFQLLSESLTFNLQRGEKIRIRWNNNKAANNGARRKITSAQRQERGGGARSPRKPSAKEVFWNPVVQRAINRRNNVAIKRSINWRASTRSAHKRMIKEEIKRGESAWEEMKLYIRVRWHRGVARSIYRGKIVAAKSAFDIWRAWVDWGTGSLHLCVCRKAFVVLQIFIGARRKNDEARGWLFVRSPFPLLCATWREFTLFLYVLCLVLCSIDGALVIFQSYNYCTIQL